MYTVSNTLEHLFAQLGLETNEAAIAAFIQQHKIAENIPLAKAKFWNDAQAQFIHEGLCEDSDWAEVIDQLNNFLHH